MGKWAKTPELRGNTLSWVDGFIDQKHTYSVPVESEAWFLWLDADGNTTFYFNNIVNDFTARREKRRKQFVWYAYKKAAGMTFKRYLGPSHLLTLDRLKEAADWFYHNV